MHENEPKFYRKIIMSDEAHFHLGGYVNKQNCRICGSETNNLMRFLWAKGIIEPYFFSIQELKEKIRAVIDEIELQMCENVMGNFMERAWSCKRSRRGHMNDIVFQN